MEENDFSLSTLKLLAIIYFIEQLHKFQYVSKNVIFVFLKKITLKITVQYKHAYVCVIS